MIRLHHQFAVDPVKNLQNLLSSLPDGPVVDARAVESALFEAWRSLACVGRSGAMTAAKILGRLENLSWSRPILSFQIERHGGTVNGSTRAELQRWEVDVEGRTRTFVSSGRRQLHAMAKRWDHRQLAETLASCIRTGERHEGLRWTKEGKVGISRKVIPQAVAQTMASRSKRLRKAIGEALGDPQWQEKSWRASPASSTETSSSR